MLKLFSFASLRPFFFLLCERSFSPRLPSTKLRASRLRTMLEVSSDYFVVKSSLNHSSMDSLGLILRCAMWSKFFLLFNACRGKCWRKITSPVQTVMTFHVPFYWLFRFHFMRVGELHENKLQFKMTYVVCFEGEIVGARARKWESERRAETETGPVHGLPYLFLRSRYIFPSRVFIAHRKKKSAWWTFATGTRVRETKELFLERAKRFQDESQSGNRESFFGKKITPKFREAWGGEAEKLWKHSLGIMCL
jgi:hypothetical protein